MDMKSEILDMRSTLITHHYDGFLSSEKLGYIKCQRLKKYCEFCNSLRIGNGSAEYVRIPLKSAASLYIFERCKGTHIIKMCLKIANKI